MRLVAQRVNSAWVDVAGAIIAVRGVARVDGARFFAK